MFSLVINPAKCELLTEESEDIIEDEETGEDIDVMVIDFVGIGRVDIPKEYWNQGIIKIIKS